MGTLSIYYTQSSLIRTYIYLNVPQCWDNYFEKYKYLIMFDVTTDEWFTLPIANYLCAPVVVSVVVSITFNR